MPYCIFKWLNKNADVRDGPDEIGPFVLEAMGECSICCVWLSHGNR